MPLNNWKKLIIIMTIINIPFIIPKALAQDAYTIAEQITVKISETGSNDQGGSGVIISKKNGKYIIATNCHVIKNGGNFHIETYIKKTYHINIYNPLSFCHPQRTPQQVDLAILEIPDDYNYPTAKPATESLRLGQKVIVAGFPAKDGTTTQRILEINLGEITRINPEPAIRGYGLVHSAKTSQGMSGGGIFNEQGQLIAISGESRESQDIKPVWRYYGILAQVYLQPYMNFDNISQPSIISSSQPVMFQKLETLLQAKKWQDADTETGELMQKLINQEQDKQSLPRKELKIIDQLWLKYSNGKFGFSVQKQIWLELGGRLDGKYNKDIYIQLAEKVGWKKNGEWLSHEKDALSNAERGYLPSMPVYMSILSSSRMNETISVMKTQGISISINRDALEKMREGMYDFLDKFFSYI
jgi:hypothetical protein